MKANDVPAHKVVRERIAMRIVVAIERTVTGIGSKARVSQVKDDSKARVSQVKDGSKARVSQVKDDGKDRVSQVKVSSTVRGHQAQTVMDKVRDRTPRGGKGSVDHNKVSKEASMPVNTDCSLTMRAPQPKANSSVPSAAADRDHRTRTKEAAYDSLRRSERWRKAGARSTPRICSFIEKTLIQISR